MSSKKEKKGSGYITHGTVAENRKARFEYEISDTYEAGLVLTGTEVKSLRRGQANIAESYAGDKSGELWLFNANIAEWEGGNRLNHEPRRHRKLLLKRREMEKLIGLSHIKGMTLVPLKIYFNESGKAKLLLGVAKGKKQHEKRESIKERDWQREQARVLKGDL